jgi:cell pole-organizing protein PopZ
MSGTQPAGDPSMDDILTSIRKILNEDEVPPDVAAAPEAEEPLDLTAEMMIAAPEPAEPPMVSPALAPVPAPEPPDAFMPAPVMAATIPASAPPPVMPPAATLVAPAAAAAAAAARGELSRAVTPDRTAGISRSPGLTIEDMVREELRPMLKEWLDLHLPPLVERLVRAEIERVVAQSR